MYLSGEREREGERGVVFNIFCYTNRGFLSGTVLNQKKFKIKTTIPTTAMPIKNAILTIAIFIITEVTLSFFWGCPS